MELYHLKTFVTVAEERHLTRAAERLCVSQPAISAHIKALEEELGLALFERTPKGMLPTAAGEALLEEEFGDDIADELGRRGHPVRRSSGASYFGSAKCIEVLPSGVLCGAADGRREGFAAGA